MCREVREREMEGRVQGRSIVDKKESGRSYAEEVAWAGG